VKLQTSDHASFQLAWQEFGRREGIELPKELALSFAGPVGGEVLKLTNNPWVIRPSLMKDRLGVEQFTIVNDFGAVGYAVGSLPEEYFRRVCGPERPLPDEGVVSIVGPGTGLGVAALLRRPDHYEVIETEGGHIDFAPLDNLEDQILAHLRRNFRRVSVERLVSGRGLWNIYDALATIEGRDTMFHDERELWTAALQNQDSLANAALDRASGRANGIAAITPERVIREGDPSEQILDVIDKDVDIALLVLAASAGAEGPGPIITMLAHTAGTFPIPLAIVPGNLSDLDIDALS